MKIILSRKGIDDKYGGGFSPILPDGTMLSIPIPQSKGTGIPYEELNAKGNRIIEVIDRLGLNVKDSKGKKLDGSDHSHLDPDLRSQEQSRHENWRGCFGQAGAAMTQLVNQGVEKGDIFLFFGNFRNTYQKDGHLNVEPQHTKHVLFGYLQIGEVIQGPVLGHKDILEIYGEHPHIKNSEQYHPNNILYIASDQLAHTPLLGWGTFTYSPQLDLTKPGYRKSIWELPSFFHYDQGTSISYHGNHDRYRLVNDSLLLETVAMGQDFVVSPSEEVTEWALSLIKDHTDQ